MIANIKGVDHFIPDEVLGLRILKRPVGYDYFIQITKKYPHNYDPNSGFHWTPIKDLPKDHPVRLSSGK